MRHSITAAFAIVLTLALAGETRAATIFLDATADTWSDSANPGANHGSDTALVLDRAPETRALMRFDLGQIPLNARVARAFVTLHPQQGSPLPLSACSVLDDWTELGTSWSNQPDFGICVDHILVAGSSPVEWDVTPLIRAVVDGAAPDHGVALGPISNGDDLIECTCADSTSQAECLNNLCSFPETVELLCGVLCRYRGGSVGSSCANSQNVCTGGFAQFDSREGAKGPVLEVQYAQCGDNVVETPEQCDPPYDMGGEPTCNDLCALASPVESALHELDEASDVPVEVRFEGTVPADVSAEVSPRLGVPADPVHRAFDFLSRFSNFYGVVDPPLELYVDRVERDGEAEHVFLGRRKGDIPVLGATIAVHLENGKVYSTSADTMLDLPGEANPQISVETALQVALADAAGNFGATNLAPTGAPRLVYGSSSAYPKRGEIRLAWRIHLRGLRASDGQGSKWNYLIDASDGSVVVAFDELHTAHPTREQWTVRHAKNTTSNTCWWLPWEGTDLWFDETGDRGYAPLQDVPADGLALGQFLPEGRMHQIWHYFEDTFGWSGYDGSGHGWEAVVHTGVNWGNASFSGDCGNVRFGDNFAALDIVGHEVRHGIDWHSAGLEYTDQSGALDESFADVFGAMVEFEVEGSGGDWLLGEDLPGGPLRNLQNPDAIPIGGGPCAGLNYPDHMSEFLPPSSACLAIFTDRDNNGVHLNSSIPNKAWYLISEGGTHLGGVIGGIGKAAMAKLAHEVHVHRLGSRAQFLTAAAGARRGAEMFLRRGDPAFTPAAVCDVKNAFGAVGLGPIDNDCDGVPDGADADNDGDGIPNASDLCPSHFDPTNADADGDGLGNLCDPDADDDFVLDDGDNSSVPGDAPCTGGVFTSCDDNCPLIPNSLQDDADGDGIGFVCEDSDADGVLDPADNCDFAYNPGQRNTDGDALGDVCDGDLDGDDIREDGDLSGTAGDNRCSGGATSACDDNCPIANASQADGDGDGVGDDCDLCVSDADPTNSDRDGDLMGDVCDSDLDGDGLENDDDSCPADFDPHDFDLDGNGIGGVCDSGEWFAFGGLDRAALLGVLRYVDVARPIRIPIQPCQADGCGDYLRSDFRTDLRLALPFAGMIANVVDEEANVVSSVRPVGTDLSLRFRPSGDTFFRTSAFAAYSGGQGQPQAPPPPGAPEPDFRARRYFLELWASPDVSPGQDYAFAIDTYSLDTESACGDANDDRFVDTEDLAALRQALAGATQLSGAGISKCSVVGSAQDCDIADVAVLRREFESPALEPRIAEVCAAALSQ